MKMVFNTMLYQIMAAFLSSLKGMRLTFQYLLQANKKRLQTLTDEEYFKKNKGIATLQYPKEKMPIPQHGRNKLHNEIDDCIVCDKCARICPVNCIEMEAIKSPHVFGKTANEMPKRLYAEKFTIDMSKCMFCGLCTTVCPTECLTMTDEYAYCTDNVSDHTFRFDKMTSEEIKTKKYEWIQFQNEKNNKPKR